MSDSLAKLKTTHEMVQIGFEISRQVLLGALPEARALSGFMRRLALPENRARTANGYWQCYYFLLTGRNIRNTISEAGWRFNLEKIEGEGGGTLLKAMYGLNDHIESKRAPAVTRKAYSSGQGTALAGNPANQQFAEGQHQKRSTIRNASI
jgi:hypothetical protein